MPTAIENTNQVRWDLSILYSDIADPRLDSDLRELSRECAKHFSATYKGKLAELLGPAITALLRNRNAQRQDQFVPFLAREHGPGQRGRSRPSAPNFSAN